jgi:hypothetical protein
MTAASSTGSGDDVVDVLRGGLRYHYSGFDTSRSLFSLGPGDDRLIGFAGLPGLVNEGISNTPIVEGRSGLDTLVLPQGTYRIVDSTVSGASSTLEARGFERLAGVTGGELAFADGSYRVDDAGIQMI